MPEIFTIRTHVMSLETAKNTSEFLTYLIAAISSFMIIFQDVVEFMDHHVGFIGGVLGFLGFAANCYFKRKEHELKELAVIEKLRDEARFDINKLAVSIKKKMDQDAMMASKKDKE